MKRSSSKPSGANSGGAGRRDLALGGVVLSLTVVLATVLSLSGCGDRGRDGISYLALDWADVPQDLYFPMLPAVVTAGLYYEHPAGTYPGEYTAWNGSHYSFNYTIQVIPGEPGGFLIDGADGADRYYTMWLYSTGPELYYVDDAALHPRSTEEDADFSDSLAEERSRVAGARARGALGASIERSSTPPVALENTGPSAEAPRHSSKDGAGEAVAGKREPYRYERSGPGYRLVIEGWAWRAGPEGP